MSLLMGTGRASLLCGEKEKPEASHLIGPNIIDASAVIDLALPASAQRAAKGRKLMLKHLLVVVSLTGAAFSQNLRYDNEVYGPKGPIPDALIAVCTQPADTNVQPCTRLAPLCSSTGDTTCTGPNPLQADAVGNYHFYVTSGVGAFTVQTSGPQAISAFAQTDQGTFPGTVGFINGAYNALACTSPASPPSWCSGSDIGAWVNAAAARCNSSQQCYIIIPPSAQLTITTPIVFANNETLECTRQNKIDNTNGSNSGAQLYYNGSGTAVTMGVYGGRFVGCDLLLGSSATAGVVMSGYSNHITDAGIRGGGTSTYLVHISGTATEDNHVERSRLSYFTGVAIGCDHANDNFITDVTAYGQTNNRTGITILEDSSCTGTQLTNVVGGNSGATFFKAQHTLGGNYPTFVFARNTQCDLAQSDCYVFASSLGSANMDYTFLDAWAAGAGGSCIHLSGGSAFGFLAVSSAKTVKMESRSTAPAPAFSLNTI